MLVAGERRLITRDAERNGNKFVAFSLRTEKANEGGVVMMVDVRAVIMIPLQKSS